MELYGYIKDCFKDDGFFKLEGVIGFPCTILHPWWNWEKDSRNLSNICKSFIPPFNRQYLPLIAP